RAELALPHPRAHDRGFVLVPWLSADPEARLRVGDDVRRVADLVDEVDTSGVRPGPDWGPTGGARPPAPGAASWSLSLSSSAARRGWCSSCSRAAGATYPRRAGWPSSSS